MFLIHRQNAETKLATMSIKPGGIPLGWNDLRGTQSHLLFQGQGNASLSLPSCGVWIRQRLQKQKCFPPSSAIFLEKIPLLLQPAFISVPLIILSYQALQRFISFKMLAI